LVSSLVSAQSTTACTVCSYIAEVAELAIKYESFNTTAVENLFDHICDLPVIVSYKIECEALVAAEAEPLAKCLCSGSPANQCCQMVAACPTEKGRHSASPSSINSGSSSSNTGTTTETPTVPFKYPLYKQCNSEWGNDNMEGSTICQVGCLMSSVSMALNGHGFEISGQPANPGTLNAWLRNNQGYTSGSGLIESTIAELDPQHIAYLGKEVPGSALSVSEVKALLQTQYTIVIANVNDGGHFVLGIGYDAGSTNLFVNDPGFAKTFYPFSQVVGWRIFQMNSTNLSPGDRRAVDISAGTQR